MMKLKFIVFIFLATLGIQQAQGQTYKFLTTGFSVMEKNDKGEWGKWSELQPASLVVTLDTNKNRLVIYSQEIQLYEILTYEDIEENDDSIVHPFTCMDDDGVPFTISIITRKNQGNRKQLYINHKNAIVVYNIVSHVDKNHK
ncbi:MAG TPA: hypothetical protein VK476_01065 [Flavobacterium sp.]|nr:hypothetical protein [Flavobacterium sp.]